MCNVYRFKIAEKQIMKVKPSIPIYLKIAFIGYANVRKKKGFNFSLLSTLNLVKNIKE